MTSPLKWSSYPICPPPTHGTGEKQMTFAIVSLKRTVRSATDYATVHHPSGVASNTLLAVISVVACVAVMINYNSVNVFNRKIQTDNISNTWWILFFAFVAAR
jgi:Trk-type K+ transport system membrane component